MDQDVRSHGGLILHILVTAYMFIAVAIMCDDYFVPSLEMICDSKYHFLSLVYITFTLNNSY